MPLPLLGRELRLLARDGGLAAVLVGFLAVLLVAGVLLLLRLVDPRGGQPADSDSPVATLVALQWMLCGLAAPWALVRVGGGESGRQTGSGAQTTFSCQCGSSRLSS